MKAKDLMISNVVKVHPETTLRELLKQLMEWKIGGVPVVNDDNRLVGMVSDGDVLRFIRPISAKHFNFFTYIVSIDEVHVDETIPVQLEKPVKSCMKRSGLVTLSAEDDFEDVVSVLSNHHFKKIPVLGEDQSVIGVISRGDVVRCIVKEWIK
jgi:CBS domain-containing protein